jgi:uncharacterized protein YjbI with pentapeptide repeats
MSVRDWLQLLIVPLALAVIGFLFTMQQDARQQRVEDQRAQQAQKIENQRAQAERELEEQRAQDEALQAYLDQMSSLLLEKDLRNSAEDSEARTLARARTLTVLRRLDPGRKATVIQFLVEADLVQSVDERDPVISLNGADIRDVNLSSVSSVNLHGADLSSADLSGAHLSDADLSSANLREADLSSAFLRNAFLRNANLSWANLSSAYLYGASLEGADLSDATWDSADLYSADLNGANLSGVFGVSSDPILINADLRNADLSGATLQGADLRGATLSDANLSDADLAGANLSHALGVTEEKLDEQAYSLALATMPEGTGHAGLYLSEEFEPSPRASKMLFRVSDGWRLAWPEKEPWASPSLAPETPETADRLALDGPEQVGELIFTRPLHVFDPNNLSELREVPAPENAEGWVRWFATHPNLETSEAFPVSFGGQSGWFIDVTETSVPEKHPRHYCDGRCVPLFPTAGPDLASRVDWKSRFVILDVEDKTVVIDVRAQAGKFDEFFPKAEKVLHTVEWHE